MKNFKTLSLILFLFITYSSWAQIDGLLMEYNLYTDEIVFKKDGEIIKEPMIKKTENVYIKVTEFNPYTTKAILDVQETNYNQSSLVNNGDFSSSGDLGLFSGINNIISSMNIVPTSGMGYSNFRTSRGLLDPDGMKIKSTFESELDKLNEIEFELNSIFHLIRKYQKISKNKHVAFLDINKLKNNPKIRPSRIQELIHEEIKNALTDSENNDLNIEVLLQQSEETDNIKNLLDQYHTAVNEYKDLLPLWEELNQDCANYINELKDPKIDYIKEHVPKIYTNINTHIDNYYELDALIHAETNSEKDLETILDLRMIYEEFSENNFKHSFPPIQALDFDQINILLNFTHKNDLGEFEDYKSLKQTIPISGIWKVTAGLGLSFGIYQNKLQRFSLNTNLITVDEIDQFAPKVTSFAHFYKKNNKDVSIGTSFGIGLPILGSSATSQAISFFLGPSLILGNNENFIFSAGIMGAKAERLAFGFKEGDFYESITETLPTINRYELGYFIGLTYNVF